LASDAEPSHAATHNAAVVELLELTGVFARAQAETDGVVARLQADNPRVPAQLWGNFAKRVAGRDTLIALYVPIYARYLTEPDVRGVVAFYRTPLGAHFLKVTPKIQEETRVAAQAWVSDIAVQLIRTADAAEGTATAPGFSQQPVASLAPRREEAVHELLRVSGAVTQAQQMMVGILDRLRRGPQADAMMPSFWELARRRLTNEADLLRLWTPAYASNLTDNEIRGLVQFYRSPVGVRFVAALPAIQEASLDAGAQLGRDAVKRAVREVLGPLPQWRLLHPEPEVRPPEKDASESVPH
jgi:hypothetical protein